MNRKQEIEAAVDRVSELLNRQIGLRPEPAARSRLRSCIRDDALGRGQDIAAYVDTVLVGGEALQGLLNRVTVQETAFFRHPEHFALLAREILPTLGPAVTIWSAACANGQEAFSLAMLLEEQGIDGRVIATDLSTEALQRTSIARYSARELGGLSPERVARHLTRDGEAWLVNQAIRDRVSTLRHNLVDPVPKQVRDCQIIFCCNVLIYFSPEHSRAFLDRVADAMPAASLFLGAAETIWQLNSRFETVRSGDTFSYRQPAEPARARALTSVSPTHNPSRGIRRTERPAPTPSKTGTPVTGAVSQRADSGRAGLTPPSPRLVIVESAPSSAQESDTASATLLTQAGQRASAAGDVQAAVVAFRKCAYLSPDDPMAHLHLGLALESAGDHPSAQRAYAAARYALTRADPAINPDATEGYTRADLVRLLDSRQRVVTP